MESSMQDKPKSCPPRKIKNILIRSSNKEKPDLSAQHPEIAHILKYSPKYYRSLTIEIAPFSPLLSKIKKIKKLKKLKGVTGKSFNDNLPQKLWWSVLGNNRKEMEEAPELFPSDPSMMRNRAFWRQFNLQKLKCFPNVVRIMLSKWKMYSNYDPLLTIEDHFLKHVWNLRRLKSLEIVVKDENYEEAEWVIWKMDEMNRLLGRLEVFIIKIEAQCTDVQNLFNNKNILSHLTGLALPMSFDPIFAKIPETCKKLNSLSLGFKSKIANQPEFLNLLISLQNMEQLKRLAFAWPGYVKNFWGHFKPHVNLKQLVLIFNVSNLLNEGLFKTDKGAVGHWEDIEELEMLTFNVSCEKIEDMIFVKRFITMVLKKVKKVRRLKYYLMCPWVTEGPFFVEEVPHLYGSLERFEYLISDWYRDYCSKFDLGMMKPFRNLKRLRLEGHNVLCENLEEVVSLMENKGEISVKISHMSDQDWLGNTLKKIKEIKKEDKNVRLSLDLTFKTTSEIELLERLCSEIHAVGVVEGLMISLTLYDEEGAFRLPVESFKEILSKYAGVRNWRVSWCNAETSLVYIKFDGEKEQFHIH